MALHFVYTKQFKKDVQLAKKRGKRISKLQRVVETLLAQQTLPPKHRDHSLMGRYKDRRECHIEPNWLLVYKPTEEMIIFERTGTHSDLFR